MRCYSCNTGLDIDDRLRSVYVEDDDAWYCRDCVCQVGDITIKETEEITNREQEELDELVGLYERYPGMRENIKNRMIDLLLKEKRTVRKAMLETLRVISRNRDGSVRLK